MFLEREPAERATDPRPILYAGVRCRPHPRPASYLIRGLPCGQAHPAEFGSLEHFLVERDLLYALANDQLYVGQVHHSPYPVQSANLLSLDETLLAAAGLSRPDKPPLAHFSGGVDVKIYALEKRALSRASRERPHQTE